MATMKIKVKVSGINITQKRTHLMCVAYFTWSTGSHQGSLKNISPVSFPVS